MKALTSNTRKIDELKAIGIDIDIFKGPDIPEVMADNPETVIVYKAIDAGAFVLVEDTVLIVDGKPIVDVKFQSQFEQFANLPATWMVSLAYHDRDNVYIFTGTTDGVMIVPSENAPMSFGFNRYFKPHGCDKSMAELLGEGEYPAYLGNTEYLSISARRKAVELFNEKKPTKTYSLGQFPKWEGQYQS